MWLSLVLGPKARSGVLGQLSWSCAWPRRAYNRPVWYQAVSNVADRNQLSHTGMQHVPRLVLLTTWESVPSDLTSNRKEGW
jgi:hypothetical protein